MVAEAAQRQAENNLKMVTNKYRLAIKAVGRVSEAVAEHNATARTTVQTATSAAAKALSRAEFKVHRSTEMGVYSGEWGRVLLQVQYREEDRS